MSNENVYRAGDEEMKDWTFSDEAIAAPAEYNPDAEGFESPPPGWHTMELYDFEISPDNEFRYKGASCILDQLRPRFRVVKGQPFAGATLMDFLPMPTRGREMLPELANRWVHFFKRLMGEQFDLPNGVLVPAGFKISNLLGKTIDVHCVPELDDNNEPKVKKDGTPLMKPKFFGYAYAFSNAGQGNKSGGNGSSSRSTRRQPAAVGAGSAATPQNFNL